MPRRYPAGMAGEPGNKAACASCARQEVMVVATTADIEDLVSEFSGADAYALDTEFHGEGRYYPRLALIQLAVPGRVAVVDVTAVDPHQLRPLFAGPGLAVTHAGGQDVQIINRACGAHPAQVFDTQIAA